MRTDRSYLQPCSNAEWGMKGNQWLSLHQTVDAKKEKIFSPDLLIALRWYDFILGETKLMDTYWVHQISPYMFEGYGAMPIVKSISPIYTIGCNKLIAAKWHNMDLEIWVDIAAGNGLELNRCQAITWTNDDILSRADSRLAPSQWETALLCNDVSHWLGTSLETALIVNCTLMSIFSKICIKIQTFFFPLTKRHLKMSAKWWPYWILANVLTIVPDLYRCLITAYVLYWSICYRYVWQLWQYKHVAALFNINIPSYQYRKCHYKDKNGNPHK